MRNYRTKTKTHVRIDVKSKEEKREQNKTYNRKNHDKISAHKKKYYKGKITQYVINNHMRKHYHALCYKGHIRIDVFNEDNVTPHCAGKMEYICAKCGALMLKDEQDRQSGQNTDGLVYSLCCCYGTIHVLPVSEPPKLLQTLLSGNSPTSHHFMKNIQAYNSSFAFASMSLTGEEYLFKSRGPYCFRISGQVYHTISQLLPQEGEPHKFSQIYLYDASEELNFQQNIFGNLNRRIVRDLQQMINCYNPYAALYHSVCDLLNSHRTQDVGLVLKTSGEEIDSRCYNVPTGTDMVIIIPVENENQPLNKNIVIYKNKHSHPSERDLISIDDKHPMYDPLLYVLMFPFGDKGWQLKCKCTQLQYYAYRLMMHSGNTF